MSYMEQLRAARTVSLSHPWTSTLRSVRGFRGLDGVERLSTEEAFEALDIPRLQHAPGAAKQLRQVMIELGWTPTRSRHVTSRGRASRVRGYCRMG
jgi:hypothetical protein